LILCAFIIILRAASLNGWTDSTSQICLANNMDDVWVRNSIIPQ